MPGRKCEKCFLLSGGFKDKKKRLLCTHFQNRRSKRISDRILNDLTIVNRILTIGNSKLPVDKNLSSNLPTDENFNSLTLSSQMSIDDDQHSSTTISHLPNEMLDEIFSYLTFSDIYFGVGGVCRHWNAIAKDPLQWRNIRVDSDMNSKLLLKLVSQASMLQTLEIKNRSDTNAILRKIIKYCPKIKTIRLMQCRGSKTGYYINFSSLMKAVTTHKILKITLTKGTGLSAPPPPASKIMREFSIQYLMKGGNEITIVPILRV